MDRGEGLTRLLSPVGSSAEGGRRNAEGRRMKAERQIMNKDGQDEQDREQKEAEAGFILNILLILVRSL